MASLSRRTCSLVVKLTDRRSAVRPAALEQLNLVSTTVFPAEPADYGFENLKALL
jgi:hypothetical protein